MASRKKTKRAPKRPADEEATETPAKKSKRSTLPEKGNTPLDSSELAAPTVEGSDLIEQIQTKIPNAIGLLAYWAQRLGHR